mmetsp:Transcript_43941/g.109578  ORF Transcript_43941/g.109578 Transcript_43941/m.109578 type:complete len:269 (-) Transcript_43941:705-1511(-)
MVVQHGVVTRRGAQGQRGTALGVGISSGSHRTHLVQVLSELADVGCGGVESSEKFALFGVGVECDHVSHSDPLGAAGGAVLWGLVLAPLHNLRHLNDLTTDLHRTSEFEVFFLFVFVDGSDGAEVVLGRQCAQNGAGARYRLGERRISRPNTHFRRLNAAPLLLQLLSQQGICHSLFGRVCLQRHQADLEALELAEEVLALRAHLVHKSQSFDPLVLEVAAVLLGLLDAVEVLVPDLIDVVLQFLDLRVLCSDGLGRLTGRCLQLQEA